jgi:hypothetical protein
MGFVDSIGDAEPSASSRSIGDRLRGGAWWRKTRAPLWGIAAAALASCVPYRALELPRRPAHSLPIRQESEGLTVAAWAVLESEEIGRYFGPQLWDAGYFAVVVHIENRAEQPVVLERDRFALRLQPDSVTLTALTKAPITTGEVTVDCESSRVLAHLLTPLVWPSLSLHAAAAEFDFEQTRDLFDKALPSYIRIEPGDPILIGALFFRRGATDEPLREALRNSELRAEVQFEGTRLETGADEGSAKSETGPLKVGRTVAFVLALRRGGE